MVATKGDAAALEQAAQSDRPANSRSSRRDSALRASWRG